MQVFALNNWWPLLLKASWQAAVLISVIIALQFLLGRRLTPRWRFRLWLLVALRLALPWTVPSSVSLFNILKYSTGTEQTNTSKAPPKPQSSLPCQPHVSPASFPALVAGKVEQQSGVPLRIRQIEGATGFSLSELWLPLIWASGASVLLFILGANHLRFHRNVARGRSLTDDRALELLERCKKKMGIHKRVTLVEMEAIDGPALFGVLRPRILFPPGFTQRFSNEELRFVLLHELGHVKRHDIFFGWLSAMLQALHWFNPLVWLAFARMRVDRELACDAVVLSYAEDSENKLYGRTVIKLLQHFGDSLRTPTLAQIVESRHQLKERIGMIATFQKKNQGRALAICIFAGLALVSLTDAQSTRPAESELPPKNKTNDWDLEAEIKLAEKGNQWAVYDLWDAYSRGHHGVQPDQAKADQWLRKLVLNLWVVRFEPIDDFAPTNPHEFLGRINQYSSARSGRNEIGAASFFRTTKQGDKLVGSFLSNVPEQLKASLAKVPGLKVTSVERITPESFVSYEQSPQQSLSQTSSEEKSGNVKSEQSSPAPKIIDTSPSIGSTDVDPALAEISVTFDQDMGGGMSWTGGGPEFPSTRENQNAHWRDKRTCCLPIKLESAHYYRVGINSTSYHNFRSAQGIPALDSAIFFTTQGASEDLKAKTAVPKIVRCEPENGAQDVSPTTTELRVTFNVPMGGGFSWCTVGDDDSDFPKSVQGKKAHWTNDKKTCVFPVSLKPEMTYRLSLNAPGYVNFQTEAGVPLEPMAYTFKTVGKP